jgi:hypothetical protein
VYDAAVGPLRQRLVGAAAVVAIVAAITGPAATARGDERPATGHLVLAGLAMAPPVYALGVTLHEGSHALAAVALGIEVTSIRLYPGIHPRNGHFYFGWVDVRGMDTRGERIVFLAAPKLTDLVLLGGYAALVLTDTLPASRYGQLALATTATGLWIDFSRDIVAWWPHNATVRVYHQLGARSELGKLPFRLLHAGLSALASIAIVKGYQGVFADGDAGDAETTLAVPVWSAAF